VTFAGTGGDLALYNLAAFASTVSGFAAGDAIDLGGFGYSAGETETFVENSAHTQGLLTVTDRAQAANLTLLGNYTSSDFTLSNDGHGGTFVKHA
jgi:large repetitive protein